MWSHACNKRLETIDKSQAQPLQQAVAQQHRLSSVISKLTSRTLTRTQAIHRKPCNTSTLIQRSLRRGPMNAVLAAAACYCSRPGSNWQHTHVHMYMQPLVLAARLPFGCQ